MVNILLLLFSAIYFLIRDALLVLINLFSWSSAIINIDNFWIFSGVSVIHPYPLTRAQFAAYCFSYH